MSRVDGESEFEASEIKPLPEPPRCRGLPLGDGHYSGCSYGYAISPR